MSERVFVDLIPALLIFVLVYLAYIDFRSFLLPDIITLPLVAFGIGFNSVSNYPFVNLWQSVLGATLGYLCLWVLNRLYRCHQKRDGIGMGDAKLLAGLGAWLGWEALPAILLIASITGLIGGLLWLKLNKQDFASAFPFGPFICFAGIIGFLWPQFIQNFLIILPT